MSQVITGGVFQSSSRDLFKNSCGATRKISPGLFAGFLREFLHGIVPGDILRKKKHLGIFLQELRESLLEKFRFQAELPGRTGSSPGTISKKSQKDHSKESWTQLRGKS